MGDGLPMEKIKNLSVRKTILLYLAVCLVCSFVLSAVIVEVATRTQEEVWWKYADHEKYFKAMDGEYRLEIARPRAQEMSKRDHVISEACDFLQTYTVLVLSITASCVAVFLFYKNKLERPIRELDLASKRIAGNDLDFYIDNSKFCPSQYYNLVGNVLNKMKPFHFDGLFNIEKKFNIHWT